MQYQNLIGTYDEAKVSVYEDNVYKGKIAWYDVTDIVKDLLDENAPSIMDYASKIEMEVCHLYEGVGSWHMDLHAYVREEYEESIRSEYGTLAIFRDKGGLSLCDDARLIRMTFKNGAVLEASNSEWGRMIILPGK